MARGSLPGTYVVRNATRVPGSAGDGDGVAGDHGGVGDRHHVDQHEEPISAMDTSIMTSKTTSQRAPPSRTVQWVGQTR